MGIASGGRIAQGISTSNSTVQWRYAVHQTSFFIRGCSIEAQGTFDAVRISSRTPSPLIDDAHSNVDLFELHILDAHVNRGLDLHNTELPLVMQLLQTLGAVNLAQLGSSCLARIPRSRFDCGGGTEEAVWSPVGCRSKRLQSPDVLVCQI